jgi:hypothetical protein
LQNRIISLVFLIILSFSFLCRTPLVKAVPVPADNARKWVQAAADAMGGERALRAIKTLKVQETASFNHIMDSEHPDGPWVPIYTQSTELIDLQNHRKQTVPTSQSSSTQRTTIITIADEVAISVSKTSDGKVTIGSPIYSQNDWYIQSPERAVLAALDSNDLRTEPDVVTESVLHHVVAFTWEKTPVRLFINSYNWFPTEVEITRVYPYDAAMAPWGDIKTRAVFNYWEIQPGGVHLPLQIDILCNGMPYRGFSISKVEINPAFADEAFTASAEARKKYVPKKVDDFPLGLPNKPMQELAPDVIQIPGGWYTTLIKQSDGVVIIEAPLSTGYSAKVIAESERRFPGVPIKAVITCSSYWWHIAGVREYIARGIPMYVLDQNRPQLEKLLASPHTLIPDALSRSPQKAKLQVVSGKTEIGSGPNRLELYPVRAATAQMMMVYFPEHHLLYTAEMAQPLGPGGSFIFPHDLATLLAEIKRQNISVNTVIGMHMSPTPLSKVEEAVTEAVAPVKSDK